MHFHPSLNLLITLIFSMVLSTVCQMALAQNGHNSAKNGQKDCNKLLSPLSALKQENVGPFSENFYDRLGIASNASDQEIETAYRRAAQKFHPDRNSSESKLANEATQNINVARDSLKNRRTVGNNDKKSSKPQSQPSIAISSESDVIKVLADPIKYWKNLKAAFEFIISQNLDSIEIKKNVADIFVQHSFTWEEVEQRVLQEEYRPYQNSDDSHWFRKGADDAFREQSWFVQHTSETLMKKWANDLPLPIQAILTSPGVIDESLLDYWAENGSKYPVFVEALIHRVQNNFNFYNHLSKEATLQLFDKVVLLMKGLPRFTNLTNETKNDGVQTVTNWITALIAPGGEDLSSALRRALTENYLFTWALYKNWPELLYNLFPQLPLTSDQLKSTNSLEMFDIEETKFLLGYYSAIFEFSKDQGIASEIERLIQSSTLNRNYRTSLFAFNSTDRAEGVNRFEELNYYLRMTANYPFLDPPIHEAVVKFIGEKLIDMTKEEHASLVASIKYYLTGQANNQLLTIDKIKLLFTLPTEHLGTWHDQAFSKSSRFQYDRLIVLEDVLAIANRISNVEATKSMLGPAIEAFMRTSELRYQFLNFFYSIDSSIYNGNVLSSYTRNKLAAYLERESTTYGKLRDAVYSLNYGFDSEFLTLLSILSPGVSSASSWLSKNVNLHRAKTLLRIRNKINALELNHLYATYRAKDRDSFYDKLEALSRKKQRIRRRLSEQEGFEWVTRLNTEHLTVLLGRAHAEKIDEVFALPNRDQIIRMMIKNVNR